MLEFTINDKVYHFRFGLGFVREINKSKYKAIEGIENAKQEVGLQFAVAGIMDKDPVILADVLYAANKTEQPRLKNVNELDTFIEECDIDEVFEQVLDCLKSANATKKTTTAVMELVAAETAKMEAAK